ncbi:uncharacterized protein LOC135475228 [Liolophura sinensis]|uniref:uncharacterized protein LOC135475228 n=1 Tax=Liolophura sinensis TaxID=3198878 RepID=UPI0031587896
MAGDWLQATVLGLLLIAAHLDPSGANTDKDIRIYPNNKTTAIPACAILTSDPEIRDELALLLERKAKSIEISISFEGYAKNPMQDDERIFYKPWLWVRTTGRHGQALLMLPFYYKMMSAGMLAIGAETMSAKLKDEPQGCLASLKFRERVALMREFLLNDFKPVSQGLTGSLSETEYVCVQTLKNVKMYGDFVHDCCRYGPDGDSICIDLTQEFWVSVLEGLLTFMKIAIFLFFPLMLPGSFYRPRYVQDRYKLELEKPVYISVYVTDKKIDADAVKCLKKLDAKQLSLWPEFNHVIKSKGTSKVPIPRNTRVNLPVQNLHLQVQQKRIISKTYVPVSVLTYLYNNFVRCKVKQVVPFNTCCKASICGTFKPKRFPDVSWLKFSQSLVRFIILMLLPLPFYIRLAMYSLHEHEEMVARKEALEIRGLNEPFSGNAVQYLSPTHPLFIIIYIVYIIEGTGIRLLSKNMRERFKFILRESFREMKSIDIRAKLAKAGKILIYPLETFGCFGFVIGIFYWMFAIPLVILAACLYFIPMIYLTWRVVYSFICIITELYQRRGKENTMTKSKTLRGQFKKQRDDLGTRDFLPGKFDEEQSDRHGFLRLKKKPFVREVMLQIFVMVCSIATIYATTILLVECVGFFVELFAFTLMGIIVNAGQTMRYVSLLFLLWLYMHDCFKTVHENYLALGTTIIDEAMGRVDQLEEVACKSAAEQANMGFVIKSQMDKKIPQPRLELDSEHELPRWKIFRPLLFLDNTDKPYVSVKFFESFNTTYAAGCPGPVLNSLLVATRKFLIMVAFLSFVLIVVLAFGDSYNISTTNQTLATVVGGMLPWLLRNFVMGKKQSIAISSFGFKFLFDMFAREHSKNWGISDLIISEPPEEEEEWDEVDIPDQPKADVPAANTEEPEVEVLDHKGDPKTNHSPKYRFAIPKTYDGESVRVKPVDLLIDLSHSDKEVEFVALDIKDTPPDIDGEPETEEDRAGANLADTSATKML